MEINRTGDLTEDISYRPYYRGVFFDFEDNVIPDNNETFYYVEGSIHRLARYLPNMDSVWDDGPDDGFNTDQLPEPDNSIDQTLEDIFTDSYFLPDDVLEEMEEALSKYSELIQVLGLYTQIDENTAQGLRRLALDAGIDPTADRAVIADAVADFILSSGTYTLMPGAIPADEVFALYFLQELQEGYCIHFATAAVLMLRSLDIPARFASGYVASVAQSEVGRSVVLTDRSAHAWAEVFYEDVGWLYLEVTPASEYSSVPNPMPHNPEYRPPVQNIPHPDNLDEFEIPTDMEFPDLEQVTPPSETEVFDTTPGAWRPPSWIVNIGRAILLITFCMALLVVRRYFSFKHRAKQFRQKNTNEAVICMWRHVEHLSRRESVPATEIEDLALKARFSQHRITEEERKKMISYTQRLAYEIYNGKDGLGRLWFKYIRALY